MFWLLRSFELPRLRLKDKTTAKAIPATTNNIFFILINFKIHLLYSRVFGISLFAISSARVEAACTT
jgi:hypothetical protein